MSRPLTPEEQAVIDRMWAGTSYTQQRLNGIAARVLSGIENDRQAENARRVWEARTWAARLRWRLVHFRWRPDF